MADKTRYRVTITTLSPLHVGSGQRLRDGFDFLAYRGSLHVANQGALFSAMLDEATQDGEDLTSLAGAIAGMTLYQLRETGRLRPEHFDPDKGLFRYVLPGGTSKTNRRGELHEEIKNVYGQPYLAGSGLKGALRTLIMWQAVKQQRVQVTVGRLKGRAKFAVQPIERDLLGRNPNYDLLRALQVGDSEPLDANRLGVAAVRVFPTGQQERGLDIDVEALLPDTVLRSQVAIDEFLFSSRASRLRFSGKRSWLSDLARVGQEHARERVVEEVEYHKAKGGPQETLRFYERLANMLTQDGLGADEFLLQLGWGAGWGSKTLGGLLKENPREFEKIVSRYGLAEGPRRRGQRGQSRREPGDPFPGTRKLATMPAANVVKQPLGWVRIKLERL